MKRVLLIISFITLTVSSFSQGVKKQRVTIKDIIGFLSNDLIFRDKSKVDIVFSSKCGSFDFSNFSCSNSKFKEGNFSNTFHNKDSVLVKLKYVGMYDDNEYDYVFNFLHYEDFIAYTCNLMDKKTKQRSGINVVFIYDKRTKNNIFFDFEDDAFIWEENNTIPFVRSLSIDAYKYCNRIFLLDNKLMPIFRSNWYKGKFVSNSSIVYSKDVIERITIYPLDCESILLSDLTLNEIIVSTEIGLVKPAFCEEAFEVYSKPNLSIRGKRFPIWLTSDRTYFEMIDAPR